MGERHFEQIAMPRPRPQKDHPFDLPKGGDQRLDRRGCVPRHFGELRGIGLSYWKSGAGEANGGKRPTLKGPHGWKRRPDKSFQENVRGASAPMIGAGIVWAIMASSMVVYWYFLWRTAQRWNMLLRRAGKTPDDDVLRNVSKLVGFVVSDQHSAFNDAKLSQLVRGARISFGIAVVGVVLWATTVAVVR